MFVLHFVHQSLDSSYVNVRPRCIYERTTRKGIINLQSISQFRLRYCSVSPACVIPWPVGSFDVGHVFATLDIFLHDQPKRIEQ